MMRVVIGMIVGAAIVWACNYELKPPSSEAKELIDAIVSKKDFRWPQGGYLDSDSRIWVWRYSWPQMVSVEIAGNCCDLFDYADRWHIAGALDRSLSHQKDLIVSRQINTIFKLGYGKKTTGYDSCRFP